MKPNITFILFIFALISSMPAHGWLGNYYTAFKTGLKSIFSYRYVNNQLYCSNVLNEIVKKNKEKQLQRSFCVNALNDALKTSDILGAKRNIIKKSKDVLAREIQSPEFSDFFNKDGIAQLKPTIFNISEFTFVSNELENRKKEKIAAEANENLEAVGKSEKPRRIDDTLQLDTKSYVKFTGNLTPNNKKIIRAALIQTVAGFKPMQNRENGVIENVPCSKKLLQATVIGTENDKNEFEWQKISNDPSQRIGESEISEEVLQRNRDRQNDINKKGKKLVRSIQIDEGKNRILTYKGSDYKAFENKKRK
jgi:hypothetical protein